MGKRAVAWIVGALFALGTLLSAIEAGGMSMQMAMSQMAMSADMGAKGSNPCHGCLPRSMDGSAQSNCVIACVAPAMAIIPTLSVGVVFATAGYPGGKPSLLRGLAFSPDPHPPKSTGL